MKNIIFVSKQKIKNKIKVKLGLVFLFILFSLAVKAQSFIVSFPNIPDSPNVCHSQGSLLKVRLDVVQASTTGASVSIALPTGLSYVAGSVIKTAGTAAMNIVDDAGSPSSPTFTISPLNLAPGEFIEFTIERDSACLARTLAILGAVFKDTVSATMAGNTITEISPLYSVIYPSLSLIQPTVLNNVVVGNTYTRNFTITNGAEGCAESVYFSIDYPTVDVTHVSLTLDGNLITPVSTVGTTLYYEISGAALTADQELCNGESLIFTEEITFANTCINYYDPTVYNVGWGCDSDPAQ